MLFILVNDRLLRPQRFCTFCCEPVQYGYVREITTRLSYCGFKCYVDHCYDAVTELENARAS